MADPVQMSELARIALATGATALVNSAVGYFFWVTVKRQVERIDKMEDRLRDDADQQIEEIKSSVHALGGDFAQRLERHNEEHRILDIRVSQRATQQTADKLELELRAAQKDCGNLARDVAAASATAHEKGTQIEELFGRVAAMQGKLAHLEGEHQAMKARCANGNR